jgi:hypothetical protein
MPQQIKASRRAILRDYLFEVARDLVMRGMVRRQRGQPLGSILRSEPRAVLREISEDFAAIGVEFLDSGARALGGIDDPVAKVAGAGIELIASVLAQRKQK